MKKFSIKKVPKKKAPKKKYSPKKSVVYYKDDDIEIENTIKATNKPKRDIIKDVYVSIDAGTFGTTHAFYTEEKRCRFRENPINSAYWKKRTLIIYKLSEDKKNISPVSINQKYLLKGEVQKNPENYLIVQNFKMLLYFDGIKRKKNILLNFISID